MLSKQGSTLNMNIMKPLYDLTNENYPPHHRLGIVLWIGELNVGIVVTFFNLKLAILFEYFI